MVGTNVYNFFVHIFTRDDDEHENKEIEKVRIYLLSASTI